MKIKDRNSKREGFRGLGPQTRGRPGPSAVSRAFRLLRRLLPPGRQRTARFPAALMAAPLAPGGPGGYLRQERRRLHGRTAHRGRGFRKPAARGTAGVRGWGRGRGGWDGARGPAEAGSWRRRPRPRCRTAQAPCRPEAADPGLSPEGLVGQQKAASARAVFRGGQLPGAKGRAANRPGGPLGTHGLLRRHFSPTVVRLRRPSMRGGQRSRPAETPGRRPRAPERDTGPPSPSGGRATDPAAPTTGEAALQRHRGPGRRPARGGQPDLSVRSRATGALGKLQNRKRSRLESPARLPADVFPPPSCHKAIALLYSHIQTERHKNTQT